MREESFSPLNLWRTLITSTRGTCCAATTSLTLSHFTNSFDQGKYDSHADSKIIADHVYKMLYGAESGTFQWSPTEKRCELEGRGSWSFRIRDHIKNRARFSSCGIVSFDTVLSDLMITGTKFRRLQSLFDDIEREPRYFCSEPNDISAFGGNRDLLLQSTCNR